MLVQGPIPQLQIQWPTVIALAIPLAVIIVFLTGLIIASHRRKVVTGRDGMIGGIGTASTDIHESGKVMVHGEYWGAHSRNPIADGAKVRVVDLDGLKLEVEPVIEETS